MICVIQISHVALRRGGGRRRMPWRGLDLTLAHRPTPRGEGTYAESRLSLSAYAECRRTSAEGSLRRGAMLRTAVGVGYPEGGLPYAEGCWPLAPRRIPVLASHLLAGAKVARHVRFLLHSYACVCIYGVLI
jgi:hypothetical protein